MKTVKIIPSICKADGSNWEGHVIMRLPTFDEKFEYIEAIGADIDEEDSVKKESKMSQIKKVRSLVKLSLKHYQEVNLKNKATGELVESVDAMQYVDDLHAVMAELAGKLIEGFKVGNG